VALRKTNRKSNASDPFAVALRLLTGRDFSTSELRKRLENRGFDEAATASAIQRCLEAGYLDDQRYAHHLAGRLVSSGQAVGPRARLELRRHGIEGELAEEALSAASAKTDPAEVLTELLQRRWPGYDDRSADEKLRRRIVAWFQRRGFPLGLIFTVLKKNAGMESDQHDF
jgi:regulatory protein